MGKRDSHEWYIDKSRYYCRHCGVVAVDMQDMRRVDIPCEWPDEPTEHIKPHHPYIELTVLLPGMTEPVSVREFVNFTDPVAVGLEILDTATDLADRAAHLINRGK